MDLLAVHNLRVALPGPQGEVEPVRGLSLSMQRGDTIGIVGESGCGKSMTALALMGLLPERARVSGSIRLHGHELVGAPDAAWRTLRGHRVAMVFQEPMSALNPLHSVGRQIAEGLRLHLRLHATEALEKARQLLEQVGIPNATDRLHAYPHQFSGGQRQRILIAMALACGPDLLIADEPTTALDATVAGDVLALLHRLIGERGMGLILISHDLALVAQHTQRLMVMYGGQVVEDGPTAAVFRHPAHPYTRGLLASRPALHAPFAPLAPLAPLASPAQAAGTSAARRPRLPSIPGTVPELHRLPPGCPFSSRCPTAMPHCVSTVPPAILLDSIAQKTPGNSPHSVNCLLSKEELMAVGKGP